MRLKRSATPVLIKSNAASFQETGDIDEFYSLGGNRVRLTVFSASRSTFRLMTRRSISRTPNHPLRHQKKEEKRAEQRINDRPPRSLTLRQNTGKKDYRPNAASVWSTKRCPIDAVMGLIRRIHCPKGRKCFSHAWLRNQLNVVALAWRRSVRHDGSVCPGPADQDSAYAHVVVQVRAKIPGRDDAPREVNNSPGLSLQGVCAASRQKTMSSNRRCGFDHHQKTI